MSDVLELAIRRASRARGAIEKARVGKKLSHNNSPTVDKKEDGGRSHY